MNADKFWRNVDRRNVDDCWPWLAATNGAGRGRVTFEGRVQYAYRVAWQLANGSPIPDDRMACHKCDNPICVNPGHLFIGTIADNTHDAIAKGRNVPPPLKLGVHNGNARVTDDQVIHALQRSAAGESDAAIARDLGVTKRSVAMWRTGVSRRSACELRWIS